jgi:hypothetical protein
MLYAWLIAPETWTLASVCVILFAAKVSAEGWSMRPKAAMARRRWKSSLGAADVLAVRVARETASVDEERVVKMERSVPVFTKGTWRD